MKKLIFTLTVILTVGCGTTSNAQSDELAKIAYIIEQGDKEEAMTHLNELLEEYPYNSYALYLRAELNYEKNDNAQAIADCTAAIRGYKKNDAMTLCGIYRLRAMTYEYAEDYDNALADYTQALQKSKDNPQRLSLLRDRADLHFQMKHYAASDADYKAILAIEPANQPALVGLARNLINQDKPAESVEILDRTVKLDPKYSAPYKFLAQAYDALGDPRKAIDNAILCQSFDTETDYSSFIAEYAAKAYRHAILKLSDAVAKQEDTPMWFYIRALVYQNSKDYANAIADYETLNSHFGDSDIMMSAIGYCHGEMENLPTAIEYFTKAIELDPAYAFYYLYRGEAKRKMGQREDAIEDYSKTIELDPMNSFAYAQRGWTKEMQGDYQGALDDHDTAIEIDDTYAYSYLYRAAAYKLLGREAEARQDYEKIVALDTIPEDGSCRQYALIELGKPDEAIEWAKQIVDSDHAAPGNYYDLACVYARLNRKSEALTALRQAFEHGYRSFGHITQDDDVDNIREEAQFKALIDEFKSKPVVTSEDAAASPVAEDTQTSVVQMKNRGSGTYEVPCAINNLPLSFIFDTGASTVTISSLEASFMLKNDYLKRSDILSKEYYVTASGSIEEGTRIRLKNVKIGDFILENVEATVVTNQSAPLLLGQSVLNRFGKVDIDYQNMKITLKK